MPSITSKLAVSVLLVGGLIAALAATGSVKTTWTFGEFTVLIYYAITNLAALRLSQNSTLMGKRGRGSVWLPALDWHSPLNGKFGVRDWESWESVSYGIGYACCSNGTKAYDPGRSLRWVARRRAVMQSDNQM